MLVVDCGSLLGVTVVGGSSDIFCLVYKMYSVLSVVSSVGID